MNKVSLGGMFLGLILLTVLLAGHNVSGIIDLLLSSGWYLMALPLAWVPSLLPAALSWRVLFPAGRHPPLRHVLASMWMGRAVNILLPVATIGGEVVKARLITLWGANAADASATVLVNKTVQALALIPWGLVGAGLLFYLGIDNGIAIPIMLGVTVLGIGIIGFILVQHFGMFGYLARLVGRFLHVEKRTDLTDGAAKTDQLVRELYRSRGKFGIALVWQVLSLMLETAEIWLACQLLGQPLGILEALALESMTSTVNNAAFFIPNAYGVQEGGFLMAGSLFGLAPDFCLALSLATRIRELVFDLPGLIFWQVMESRRFLALKPGNS